MRGTMPLPPLGNSQPTYHVTLSEAEINAIHFAVGFSIGGCMPSELRKFAEHYGPTLRQLSKRLQEETETT